MTTDGYRHPYNGKDVYLKYFSEHPVEEWGLQEFQSHFQNTHLPSSTKTLQSAYYRALSNIERCKKTPESIVSIIRDLRKEAEPSSSITYITYNENSNNNNNNNNNNTIVVSDLPPETRSLKRKKSLETKLQHKKACQEKNNEEDENSLEISNDISFTSSNGTDESFKDTDQANTQEEKLRKKHYYYISSHEIIEPLKTLQLYYFYEDTTFEERVLLSHINIIQPEESIPAAAFSPVFNKVIESYRRSIAYKMDMSCTNFDEMNKVEKSLAFALHLQSMQIQKTNQLLSCALLSKFTNPRYNREFDFTMKHIFLLINSVFLSSALHLDWDSTSNIYRYNPEKSMQCCRHDMIFTNNEGLEIGTGEVKPPNTAIELIDIDRSRIAESLKKQLHRRLYTARSPKELCTFGILVYGNKLELTMMNLTASGSYDYRKVHDANLSTTFDDYAFINETLEIVCSFVRLAEDSLPTNEDKANDLILPDYARFIKPTVYMSNIEDNDDDEST
ncbi:hypothetical protein MBANPS3_012489 [Mucor bainieri]